MICTGTDRQAADELRELGGERPLSMYRLHGMWYVGTLDEIEPLITEAIVALRPTLTYEINRRGYTL